VIRALRRLAARRRAERVYCAAASLASRSMGRLGRTAERTQRAAHLRDLVEHLQVMAGVYTAAFGPSPNPNEDGRDLAESARSEVVLAGWLAQTEDGRCPVGPDHPACRVLAELAVEAGPTGRAQGCLDLWAVVVPEVGGQAAELLVALTWEYRRLAGGVR
jgi:hypothetical protein